MKFTNVNSAPPVTNITLLCPRSDPCFAGSVMSKHADHEMDRQADWKSAFKVSFESNRRKKDKFIGHGNRSTWWDHSGNQRHDSIRDSELGTLHRESQLDLFRNVHDCIRQYAKDDAPFEQTLLRCTEEIWRIQSRILLGDGETQTPRISHSRAIKLLRPEVRKRLRVARRGLENRNE